MYVPEKVGIPPAEKYLSPAKEIHVYLPIYFAFMDTSDTLTYLSQKELSKLFRTIEKGWKSNHFWLRDLAMYHIVYFCWLRASEVGMIRCDQYNRKTGEIFVKRLKWSLNNTIRLDETRRKVLDRYIREYSNDSLCGIHSDDDFLFKSKNGKSLAGGTVHYIFRKHAVEAGFTEKKRHVHILKHSCAVHLAESGVDIKELQFYLGHKSIDSTLCYFSFTSKQLDAMYEKLEKRSEMAR